ncbi:hypothetical protein GE061_016086 [Apolygus lucorum]|uniref:Uncharacterized protein n=1 Tax=Apolygus lucorum TaxID=248454 RepID=A0A8S9XGC9_APOLU|nr:hypothetical protein GE061_016086 [Apolygus lucorum]
MDNKKVQQEGQDTRRRTTRRYNKKDNKTQEEGQQEGQQDTRRRTTRRYNKKDNKTQEEGQQEGTTRRTTRHKKKVQQEGQQDTRRRTTRRYNKKDNKTQEEGQQEGTTRRTTRHKKKDNKKVQQEGQQDTRRRTTRRYNKKDNKTQEEGQQEGTRRRTTRRTTRHKKKDNKKAGDPCNPGALSKPPSTLATTFAAQRKLHDKEEALSIRRRKLPTYAEVTKSQPASSPHCSSAACHHSSKEADTIDLNFRYLRSRRTRPEQASLMEHLADRHPKDQEKGSGGSGVLPLQKQSTVRGVHPELCGDCPHISQRRNKRRERVRRPISSHN